MGACGGDTNPENNAANNTNNTNNGSNNLNNPSPDCQDGDVSGEFEGAIEVDTIFCGEVEITGDVYTSDVVDVTFRPGTRVRLGVDRKIEFGWAGNETTVIAQGTEENPIIFEGTTAERGHWLGLMVLSSVTSDSVFDHIIVRHAGSQDSPAIRNDNERGISFKNITIEEAGATGFESASFKADSVNLTVRNSEGPVVSLTNSRAVTNFPLGGVFEDNTENYIGVDFANLDTETVWHKAGVHYQINEDLYNGDEIDVTIEAGVEFVFSVDRSLEFGWAGNGTTVTIAGTEAEPVVFRGLTEASGHWNGVRLNSTVSTASTISYLEIKHAGSEDYSAMSVESIIELKNVTFSENENASLRIDEQGLKATSSDITIVDAEGASAEVHSNAWVTVPMGGSYGSGTAYVEVYGGRIDANGTIPAIDVPYRVVDSIYNGEDLELEIASGTTIQFSSGTLFEMGWAGNGASFKADNVEFVGATAAAGFWDGVKLNGSVTTDSYIRNSTISHSSDYGIQIDKVGIDFTGNTVNETTGYCVGKLEEDATDYAGTNTLNCTLGAVINL
jgi:hypothetical protein